MRQATMLAFRDAFLMLSVLMLSVIGLVFLMKRAEASAGPPGH
jgi:hypothetical protein